MSFAYPSVLAFLAAPVLLIAWVWRRDERADRAAV